MTTVKKGLDKVLAALTAILFAALTLTVIWQVFSRQVLRSAPAWTSEAANYLFVWTSMIAIAFVFGERGHMAVVFLAERFPRKARIALAVVVQACIIAFAALVMIWGGARSAENAWLQNSIALPITIGPMYTVMPIAGVFIIFYAVYHITEDLKGKGPLTVEDPSVVQAEQVAKEATVADMDEAQTILDDPDTDPDPALTEPPLETHHKPDAPHMGDGNEGRGR